MAGFPLWRNVFGAEKGPPTAVGEMSFVRHGRVPVLELAILVTKAMMGLGERQGGLAWSSGT